MPSVIDPIEGTGDCYISIFGDTLKIDPILKPKPSAGVHVWFAFEICHKPFRQLAGIVSLWPRHDVDPRPADADDFRDLEGLDGLDDITGENVRAEDFDGLKDNPVATIPLLDLAQIQLGNMTALRLEEAFLEGTLRAFLDTYVVTAEMACLNDGSIQVTVTFANDVGPMHLFIYVVGREAAEQLFTYEKQPQTT